MFHSHRTTLTVKKLWMPNRLKMWTLKSRLYFLLVQSKNLNSKVSPWPAKFLSSRGMVAWMCGYERKIANGYWIYVSEIQPAVCERSLTDKPKKGRCTTYIMVSSKCCQTLGSSSGTEGWPKFWYLLLEAWNLGKLDSWSLRHAEPGMYVALQAY